MTETWEIGDNFPEDSLYRVDNAAYVMDEESARCYFTLYGEQKDLSDEDAEWVERDLRYGVGKGWEPTPNGKGVENVLGRSRLNSRTGFAHFARALSEAGMDAPRDADEYKGLVLRMNRKDLSFEDADGAPVDWFLDVPVSIEESAESVAVDVAPQHNELDDELVAIAEDHSNFVLFRKAVKQQYPDVKLPLSKLEKVWEETR